MKALIVDDHQLFSAGLHLVLKRANHVTHIMEANSLDSAIESITHNPDIGLILLDLHLSNSKNKNGLELTAYLDKHMMAIPIVVISASDEKHHILSAKKAGVLGYIPKSLPDYVMLEAIEHVLDGGTWFPVSNEELHSPKHGEKKITRRQMEVLKLVAEGYSNKQIAEQLYISETTIKSHISALFNILGVSNRTQCVLEANKLGFFSETSGFL